MEQKRWFGWRSGLALVVILGAAPGCDDDDDDDNGGNDAGGQVDAGGEEDAGRDAGIDAGDTDGGLANCVEVARKNGNFTTLITAVTGAGLATTLSGDGPFTIFAPTDDAFTALTAELAADDDPNNDDPVDTAEELAQLKSVLEYHVLDTEVSAAQVAALPEPGIVRNTVLGLTLFTSTEGTEVTINDRAKVTTADIPCSNGVIHVIDKVLLPLNIAQAATVVGGFTTLLTAVTDADLVGALTDPAMPVTVFAPSDAAFTAAGLTAADADADILSYHVVSGSVPSSALTNGTRPTLLTGETLTIDVSASGVNVNTANVAIADIATTTGIIHVIDRVLNPANNGVFPLAE